MQVKIEHLTKRFGDFTAVEDFNMVFDDGKLVALLGPSGCGKSTILNMLSGILPSTSGKIYFDETDVTNVPPQDRGVGLVFQNYALYPHMSVLENIAFPLEIKKVPKEERNKKAEEMARLVHVDQYLHRKPKELSGGQQQRVAIARALIKQPRLLLLDEPLSNLDARLRLEMREEIRRIQLETGVTTVFVTHDQEEAMSISDKIVLMKNGVLQQEAGPQELYDNPANLFVANFLGNPPINNLNGYIKDGYFVLEDESGKIKINNPNVKEGQQVVMGIRAESVAIKDGDHDFEATVKQRYTMGKEELAFLNIGNQTIRVYLSSDYEFKEGETVFVKLRDKGVFLFDKETGVQI
ncbi:MAG: ABC transporter ATP-binding protein [Erysipelotrichaceae bacterium]|nr:ABC transporter ATP-binding protein [Erysipelotrichaceae bacterium]MBQ1810588.1 ABC transporter ATP-binding protein [Erysipelotrichaceae bacterium]MBR3150658.1 ABC transporter ATP-binding protein [Erysipelotrichaceae bacterium]MBR3167510.1 ABC transporter ATP-binding protein [Erysipelotrichaceae bacterium]